MFTIGLTLALVGALLLFLTFVRAPSELFKPLVLLYVIAAQILTAGVTIVVLYEAGVLKIIPTE